LFKVSPQLQTSFQEAVSKNIRFIKINISDSVLNDVASQEGTSDLASDYASIQNHLTEACFIVFRNDEDKWILLKYVPEETKVRDRMPYAQSVADLKTQLGGASLFIREIFGTTKDELSWKAYQEVVLGESAQIMTSNEISAQEELMQSSLTSNQVIGSAGLKMPVTEEAQGAFRQFASSSLNWVEIDVDVKTEKVHLKSTKSTVAASELTSLLPNDAPRYALLRHEGNVVFIFSCPDNAPARHRMIFASSKQNVVDTVSQFNIAIDKKTEVRSPSDIGEALGLGDTSSTQTSSPAPATFSKPARPGRGPMKILS